MARAPDAWSTTWLPKLEFKSVVRSLIIVIPQPPAPPAIGPDAALLDQLGLTLSRYGYYEATRKPTSEELQKYYRDNYYQVEDGSYLLTYDGEELRYIRGQVAQRHRLMQSRGWLPEGPLSLLDVGCGEGHALHYFSNLGWSVRGLDFSIAGCTQMNPGCLPWLTQGDVFENLDRLVNDSACYDLVMLDNVLEHVIDPPALLRTLHRLVKPEGVLVVEVPNDFSRVQMTALSSGWIDRAFWVCQPHHLSYFNAEGLQSLCSATGWKCAALMSDFPIDWFLANPNSNYIVPETTGTGKGSALGMGAHRARIALENMMREADPDGINRLYEAMAETGAGRSIIGFFKKG